MEKRPLYTIGHGTRKQEVFLELLQRYGIKYLVDVRSRPYSHFNPQFNRERLKEYLAQNDITYVFMGDTLGGRPEDPTCHDMNGKVDYEKVKTKPFFRDGIERLKKACWKDIHLAIMCSETKPQECHRSGLIGNVLQAEGVLLAHIDEEGGVKKQIEVTGDPKGLTGANLFGGSQT